MKAHTPQNTQLSIIFGIFTYPLKSVHLEYNLTLRSNIILWRFLMPARTALIQQLSAMCQKDIMTYIGYKTRNSLCQILLADKESIDPSVFEYYFLQTNLFSQAMETGFLSRNL